MASEAEVQEVLKAMEGASVYGQRSERKGTSTQSVASVHHKFLQQEAARKLGFRASKTMSVAQQLYEGVDLAKKARLV